MSDKSNVVPLFGTQAEVDDKAKKDEDATFEVSLSLKRTGEVVGIATEHFPDDLLLADLLVSSSESFAVKCFDVVRSEDEELDCEEIMTLSLDEGEWWEE